MSIQYPVRESYGMEDLLRIMEILRSSEGCPWDKVQTHESIRQNFIEETYEAVEAIDLKDVELLKEELGDVLLQVVYHARMEEEEGRFGFGEVCDGVCRKLIQRHPHVFGQTEADTQEKVLDNWEKIKQDSKGQTTQLEAVLSVPKTFPALMRAQKVQKRAGKSGFEYPDVFWAMDDLESELDELQDAVDRQDQEGCGEELGDLLFAAVNVARKLSLDSELCLTRATEKFIRRFRHVEELARERGIVMDPDQISQLQALWKEAKALDRAEQKDCDEISD